MRNKNVARACWNKMNDWLLCCIDIQLCDTNSTFFTFLNVDFLYLRLSSDYQSLVIYLMIAH